MGLGKIPEDVAKQAEDRRRQLDPMAPDLAKIFNAPQEKLILSREAKKTPKAISSIKRLKRVFKIRGNRAEINLRLEVITDVANSLERTRPGVKEIVRQEVRSIRSAYKGRKFQIAPLDQLLERLEGYRSSDNG